MLIELLKCQLQRAGRYKASVEINMVFILLAVYVNYSLYSLLEIGDYEQRRDIFFYTLLSTSLSQTMATNRIPLFCKELRKGTIVRYYKYPMSFFRQFIYDEIGESVYSFIGISVFVVFTMFFKVQGLPQLGITIIMLILSGFMSILIAIIVFSLSFLLMSEKCAKALLTCVSDLLSGTMLPLVLLPKWFRSLCYYTPFPYLIDAPISILLGEEIQTNIVLMQLIWIVILYITGKLVLNCTLKSVVVYGG